MIDQWYYGQGVIRNGPCSADQLKVLAAAGNILPTDTVWRVGTVRGALAKNVTNLFAASQQLPDVDAAALVPLEEDAEAADDADAEAAGDAEPTLTEKAPSRPTPPKAPLKGRAIAIKGAIIVSQDDTYVNYKKKCSVCGFQDGSRHRMLIRNGLNRGIFFCAKCKKARPVEINGHLG